MNVFYGLFSIAFMVVSSFLIYKGSLLITEKRISLIEQEYKDRLKCKIKELNEIYSKRDTAQMNVIIKQRKRMEFYKKTFAEIGGEIHTETSKQFDPREELGFKELCRINVRYDKAFLVEGYEHYLERIDELNKKLSEITSEVE